MSDALDWHEARRLAGYVRSRGRLGLHRADADALMGGTVASRKAAFGLAWSRRWVDCCGPYLVVPPRSTGFGDPPISPTGRTAGSVSGERAPGGSSTGSRGGI